VSAHLHHIGWVVRSVAQARPHFERQLGLEWLGQEDLATVRAGFLGAGGTTIELLEPLPGDTVVAAFLEERGEGIHHLAYAVEDVAAALVEAAARGMRPLDRSPRPGARGSLIGFVDPARPDGILVEYVQDPGGVPG
jgi:methylmalonyl-CoA/ethylmalonyl-CoA epimerase